METHIDLHLFEDSPGHSLEEQHHDRTHQVRKPRRMHGKHTILPDGQVAPALRHLVLRAGGKSGDGELSAEQAFWLRSLKSSVDTNDRLVLLQHQALDEVIQQLVSELNEGIGAEWNGSLIKKVREEQRGLEAYLRAVQACEDEVLEQEVLQTKTVAMQEVGNEYEEWIKLFQEEYNELVRTVIQPLDEKEQEVVLANSTNVERIPAKLVATIKPPSKKRGRIVACGNLSSQTSGETSASSLDCIALRAVLRLASHEKWDIVSTDVRRAFLHAPRLEHSGRTTLIDPPMLLQKMGITRPKEVWRVTGALYGLCESPYHWAVHRDGVLQGLSWEKDQTRFSFQESEERNLWRIVDLTNHATCASMSMTCC